MQIEELYYLYCKYPKISTDSRNTTSGSIFFGLEGQTFDGNQFAAEAIHNGAQYAVVSKKEVIQNNRYVLVENTLRALQDLAAYHRQQLTLPVIAITGSNGKTTTKELIRSVLSQRFKVTATIGNLNNHIGVPLTVLNINKSHQIAIVEMGANHTGEIRQLCEIAQPDYGLITNIGKAHLEGFGSLEGVKKAKGELYQYLGSRNGTIFANAGNTVLMQMLSGYRGKIICYGNGPDSACTGEIKDSDPFIEATITMSKSNIINACFPSKLIGRYNIENILAAVCTGSHFGLSEMELRMGIEKYSPENYRSQFIQTPSNKLFMDAYNANPTSVKVALTNFVKEPDKNKVIILGEMLELGNYSLNEHQEVVNQIERIGFNRIFLVGKGFTELNLPQEYLVFYTVEELSNYLKQQPISNSSILIKGSRLIGLEKLIPLL